MRKFEPAYWTTNFNVDCAAALTTPGADEMKVTINFRTEGDLVGLIWEAADTISHQICRYKTDNDFSSDKIEFDLVMSGVAPIDAAIPPTLTVEHLDGSFSYIRLFNYTTSLAPDGLSGHVSLDFASVLGGWEATDPVDWTDIKRMFVSIIPEAYVAGSTTPLATEVVAEFHATNIVVTGPEIVKFNVAATAHRLRIADGYDDAYNLTPERIVDSIHGLGYRDWYNIYIGLSHHHAVVWDSGEARFVVDPSKPSVSEAARAWWEDMVTKLVAKGFDKIVVSVSYEIIHYLMPSDWYQRDHAGVPGESGWTPPSRFISPCRTDALDYLASVANYLVGRVIALGGEAYFQIGEPWWWDNSYVTSGGPCFYDYATLLAYNADTGLYAPTPFLTSVTSDFSSPEQTAFVHWLGDKLGQSTNYIRDAVKAAHPVVKTMILIYTPQVFSHPMLEIVNLPVSYWKTPQYDVLQVEDYDWIIARDWTKHATTWETAFTTLGYAPEVTQFFSGFNLAPETASAVWPGIVAGIKDSYRKCSETYVWARPQVWRDKFVWDDRDQITIGTED